MQGNVGIVYFNEDNTDLFGMELIYNEGFSDLSGTDQFNGNISGMRWQVEGDQEHIRGYGFQYDDISRLKKANYAEFEDYNWSAAVDNYSVGGSDNGGIS